jgi:uncharacterized DUF497 family protein
VEFEWDESKSKQVMEKHGFDILYAALTFENHVLTKRITERIMERSD